MEKIYENPLEAQSIANKAFSIILEEYNENTVSNQHINIYKKYCI